MFLYPRPADLIRLTSAALLVGLAALVSAGPAGAAAEDAGFLANLRTAGIELGSPEHAIALGRAVCQDLRNGLDSTTATTNLAKSGNLAIYDAAIVYVAAVDAYCPEFTGTYA